MQIIVEACIGLGVALWSYLPKSKNLLKVKLADHAKDRYALSRLYDQFDARPSFENYMSNRGRLRALRIGKSLPAPPKSL